MVLGEVDGQVEGDVGKAGFPQGADAVTLAARCVRGKRVRERADLMIRCVELLPSPPKKTCRGPVSSWAAA